MKSALFLVVALSTTSISFATDGLVSKIPATKQWVSFNVTTRIGHEDGSFTNSKGVVVVRCLTTERIDGKHCRWLEFEHSWEQPVDEKNSRRFHSSVTKIAVVESALIMGFNPTKDIIRGYHAKTSADHKPESWTYNRVTKIKKGTGSYTGLGAVDHYLRPALENPMKLPNRTILLNKSKLKCTGFKAQEKVDRKGENQDFSVTYSQWKNPNVPFGVVEFQISERRKNGTIYVQKLTMKDSGKKAVSSIATTD